GFHLSATLDPDCVAGLQTQRHRRRSFVRSAKPRFTVQQAQRALPRPERQQLQDLRDRAIAILDLPDEDPKPPWLLIPGEGLGGLGQLSGLAEIVVLVRLRLQARKQLSELGS